MTITHSRMTAIITRYYGPTNTRGSRIIADAGLKRRIIVSYDSKLSSENNHAAAAEALCAKFKWNCCLRSGGHERGLMFVFQDI